jgi:hypothetical protein
VSRPARAVVCVRGLAGRRKVLPVAGAAVKTAHTGACDKITPLQSGAGAVFNPEEPCSTLKSSSKDFDASRRRTESPKTRLTDFPASLFVRGAMLPAAICPLANQFRRNPENILQTKARHEPADVLLRNR